MAVLFSPSITWMYGFRFIAGMGAAAVLMTSIASVRDRFSGDEMARIMSLIFSIFLFTPIFAPALGALVLHHSSWQVVFLIPPIFALFVLMWSFRIDESHPVAARNKTPFLQMMPQIKSILGDNHFMRYTIIATLLFAVLSSYVSSSERIIGEIYDSARLFPYIFGGIGILMSIFSLSNSFITQRLGAKKTLLLILRLYLVTSMILLGCIFIMGDPPSMILFFILLAILMAFTTMDDPNSSSMALEHMGGQAGLAASIYGTLFFFFGSLLGAAISSLITGGIWPLALGAFLCSGLALILANKK
jgi:MFS transporter, DHA1 family, multidrug resistance protein